MDTTTRLRHSTVIRAALAQCPDAATEAFNAIEEQMDQLKSQRDETLSMLGAVIALHGGEVRINDKGLMVGYTFESYRDEITRQTVIRVTVA